MERLEVIKQKIIDLVNSEIVQCPKCLKKDFFENKKNSKIFSVQCQRCGCIYMSAKAKKNNEQIITIISQCKDFEILEHYEKWYRKFNLSNKKEQKEMIKKYD